jgi:hypothetical protein
MGTRTVVAGLVLVLAAACSSPTKQTNEAAEQPLPTVEQSTTTRTAAPSSSLQRSPSTTAKLKLTKGSYCKSMHAAGWSFAEVQAYYLAHGSPAHMDADGNGVPCETVYGKQGGSGPTTDPRWGQTCEEIGHPYTALPGDPYDGDHDGIACED